jgi:hypothetical protein
MVMQHANPIFLCYNLILCLISPSMQVLLIYLILPLVLNPQGLILDLISFSVKAMVSKVTMSTGFHGRSPIVYSD